MNPYQEIYEDYHKNNPFSDFGKNTFMGEWAEAAYPDTETVLDFGCGNGYAVTTMRALGRNWYGLEYSESAYNLHLQKPYFFLGDTRQFQSKQFDMGYSTEVFEHIPESIIDDTINDYCRVISKYLFMTISLRPSSDNNKYHCTLRPRSWWEEKFSQHGFIPDREIVNLHQRHTIKSTRRILQDYAHLGPEAKKFSTSPPYELNGEREPWFFCFRRDGVQSPGTPAPQNTWINRNIIPIARKILCK